MNPIGLALLDNAETHPAPPTHPESPQRLAKILPEFKWPDFREITQELPVRKHNRSVLAKIHDEAYLDELAGYDSDDFSFLDPDTYRTRKSYQSAVSVTDSLLSAVDCAYHQGPTKSFILGRPPGHHAGTKNGMGFCLINHVAVAAQYAIDEKSVERVAIVDFDVHHGNGTQDIFYNRSDVIYISTHQSPAYPGTGSAEEKGEGEGQGYTFNLPLPAGTEDITIIGKFLGPVSDRLKEYHPEIIFVSAGFDGHTRDPLGGFHLSGAAFAKIGEILRTVSDELCDGRLISVLEGGYDPLGNLDSISSFLKGLTT